MQIGLIGLGKMGKNLALNLNSKQHEVVAYDKNHTIYPELEKVGIETANELNHLVTKLSSPRIIWMMIPSGQIIDDVIDTLLPTLNEGDIVLDGGNSFYRDSQRRNQKLLEKGVYFFDVGTSGGMEGALNGACTMIGGNDEVFKTIEPIFKDASVEKGYLYTGKSGSGHFLKMIHNGIEYGMMQAMAEGFDLLEKSEFDFDYKEVARVWNHGSVIRSWLMELMENAFSKEPKLDSIKGVMNSSGEGKWTVETALELQANAPVIAMSQFMRYRSLENDTFSGKVVAALRNEFGGHAVEKK